MKRLHEVAAAGALLAMGGAFEQPFLEREPEPYDPRYDPARRLIFAEPARATFISERPLGKRARRRLRGKAKGKRA